MFYFYILKYKDDNTYIGYTNDLRRRFKGHEDKASELVYYEAYKSKTDAQTRERMLKQRGQTVERLKEKIKWSLA